MSRHIYIILGWSCVVLGLIGAFLPLLPTTAFMILAAFLFGRGSPRARTWLINHRVFGPAIVNWEATGAIARPAKIWSCVAMAAALLLSWALGLRPLILAIQALCMAGAAAFILTRPD